MAYQAPSGNNGFIPTHDATDGMIVGFSRNPKAAAINRYAGLKPVSLTAGKYLRLDPANAARVRDDSGADSVWADGGDRPSGQKNANRFEYTSYSTTRHNESVTTGSLAVQQADWGLEDANGRLAAGKIMTLRVRKAIAALAGASFATTDAATICGSGKHMGNGDAANPYVKKVFQYVGRAINKATYGVIKPSDLVAVFNPDSAAAISQSAEVQAAFIQSQYALGQLTGAEPNLNAEWFLPSSLYGMKIEVEDWVYESAKEYSTAAPAYALPFGTVYFLARPDGLVLPKDVPETTDGDDGNYFPTRNTLVGFFKEEMTVEAMEDSWNRRTTASVTTNFQYQITSLLSGYKVTAAFGA